MCFSCCFSSPTPEIDPILDRKEAHNGHLKTDTKAQEVAKKALASNGDPADEFMAPRKTTHRRQGGSSARGSTHTSAKRS